jgi:hypothetical protein
MSPPPGHQLMSSPSKSPPGSPGSPELQAGGAGGGGINTEPSSRGTEAGVAMGDDVTGAAGLANGAGSGQQRQGSAASGSGSDSSSSMRRPLNIGTLTSFAMNEDETKFFTGSDTGWLLAWDCSEFLQVAQEVTKQARQNKTKETGGGGGGMGGGGFGGGMGSSMSSSMGSGGTVSPPPGITSFAMGSGSGPFGSKSSLPGAPGGGMGGIASLFSGGSNNANQNSNQRNAMLRKNGIKLLWARPNAVHHSNATGALRLMQNLELAEAAENQKGLGSASESGSGVDSGNEEGPALDPESDSKFRNRLRPVLDFLSLSGETFNPQSFASVAIAGGGGIDQVTLLGSDTIVTSGSDCCIRMWRVSDGEYLGKLAQGGPKLGGWDYPINANFDEEIEHVVMLEERATELQKLDPFSQAGVRKKEIL